MKKITLLFIAMILASFSAFAVDMAGPYKVGSTVGADYTSLSAAINALNAATISGDVVFEITSDITEAANFGLAKDMGSFKLTIRPDADADRTITFTQAIATLSSATYGHFLIGSATANIGTVLSDATVVATNNITIDGYAVGGNTRRLKLTTTADALTNSVILNIVGGSANTIIKNTTIDNQSTSTNPRCVYITQFKGTTLDVSPSNILIENNIIKSVPTLSTINGNGIVCTRSGSASSIIENLDIKNNIITTSGNGVEINYANGADILGNEFKVQKQTGTGISSALYFRGKSGNMNVIGNKFLESSLLAISGTVSIYTISSSANGSNPFVLNIFNNTFSGMNRTTTGATALNQTYIGDAGYGTTKVYNNSFYLPALSQSSQAGYYHAFKFTGSLKAADIQNNIFISNEDSKSVLISDPITSGTMNNNIYYLRAGNTNARVVGTYSTLSAFQTANPTLDKNSKSVDVVFTNAATGDLNLTGASVGNVDLAALKLSSVTTDINTTNRQAITYIGAHEASNLTTVAKYFTVNVPNGTEKVYVAGSFTNKVWDKDAPFQLKGTGTANQFAGILPCVDGVNYKYMCATGDWDFEEGKYNDVFGAAPTKLAADRTYNATDNVILWYRVNKLAFNVTFTTNVPNTLFMKGSFNNWTAGVPLTRNGNTYSITQEGNPGDKFAANIEYKYYTNDDVADNWESDASGIGISNRWTVAPVMNDVVARFTTAITTGLDKALMQAGVQISKAGIYIPVNETSSIELYTLNGMLIDRAMVNNSYSRALNNGAYIVKINGKAVKFVK